MDAGADQYSANLHYPQEEMMISSHQFRGDELCTYTWHLLPCGRPRNEHEEVSYCSVLTDDDINAALARDIELAIINSNRLARGK